MTENQLQTQLRDSHDTLIGERAASFRRPSTGSVGSVQLDELNKKTNNERSTQAMDSTSASPSDEDTTRDIEKDAAVGDPQLPKQEMPNDPNLVEFDGPGDPGNPQNFSKGKKWRITILLSLLTLTITFSSSVFSTAIFVVSKKYHVGAEVATLGVS